MPKKLARFTYFDAPVYSNGKTLLVVVSEDIVDQDTQAKYKKQI